MQGLAWRAEAAARALLVACALSECAALASIFRGRPLHNWLLACDSTAVRLEIAAAAGIDSSSVGDLRAKPMARRSGHCGRRRRPRRAILRTRLQIRRRLSDLVVGRRRRAVDAKSRKVGNGVVFAHLPTRRVLPRV